MNPLGSETAGKIVLARWSSMVVFQAPHEAVPVIFRQTAQIPSDAPLRCQSASMEVGMLIGYQMGEQSS